MLTQKKYNERLKAKAKAVKKSKKKNNFSLKIKQIPQDEKDLLEFYRIPRTKKLF